MVLFSAFLFCLITISVAAREDSTMSIHPETLTHWGSWGKEEWCPTGTYAYGFGLKVEAQQGSGDDTALNGVKLHCRSYCGSNCHSVTSSVMEWGRWTPPQYCPGNYFLKGASVKSERYQPNQDDTAANSYNFLCEAPSKALTYQLVGEGASWGSWSSFQHCTPGSYICGIKTQVEGKQGGGDDTALNDAIFYCCRLIKTSCS